MDIYNSLEFYFLHRKIIWCFGGFEMHVVECWKDPASIRCFQKKDLPRHGRRLLKDVTAVDVQAVVWSETIVGVA